MLYNATVYRDEAGKVIGIFAAARDITERERYENELIQSKELIETAFNSIDTHIAYMDRDFNFIQVNDAYARAGGHPAEFFIGKNHFELYPHEENQAIFQRVVDTGEPYSVFEKPFEYAEYPERGVTYWDWSLLPVTGGNGRVQGVVLSLVDVTERKRAEGQLERQNQELQALSTAEHKQRQLAEGLAHATLALNERLDMETVLDRIFEQARRIIPFTGANIALLTEDLLHTARSWGFEERPQVQEIFQQPFSIKDFPILQEISRSHKPVLIEDTTQGPGWFSSPAWNGSALT